MEKACGAKAEAVELACGAKGAGGGAPLEARLLPASRNGESRGVVPSDASSKPGVEGKGRAARSRGKGWQKGEGGRVENGTAESGKEQSCKGESKAGKGGKGNQGKGEAPFTRTRDGGGKMEGGRGRTEGRGRGRQGKGEGGPPGLMPPTMPEVEMKPSEGEGVRTEGDETAAEAVRAARAAEAVEAEKAAKAREERLATEREAEQLRAEAAEVTRSLLNH